MLALCPELHHNYDFLLLKEELALVLIHFQLCMLLAEVLLKYAAEYIFKLFFTQMVI